MPEAARIDDAIGHVSVWARLARVGLRVAAGMAEAVLVGAAIVGVAALMSTPVGWCGAIFAGGLIAGFVGGATGWSDYKEKKIKELTEDIGSPTVTGAISRMGSPDVQVNGKAAARAIADSGACSRHSGPIPIAEGSDSVWINTFPAARKGDKLQCSAAIVEGSANVFIGGAKTAYMEIADDKEWWETALEIGIGLAMGRGSFGARLGCLGMGMLANMAADRLGRGFRSLIGYPVHPATGGKILTGAADTDFVLPGPLPIVWKRRYSSHDRRADGPFGTGWSVAPHGVSLRVQPGAGPRALVYTDEAGREVEMPALQPGHGLFNVAEMFSIGCTPGGHYEVTTLEGLLYQFGAPAAPEVAETLPLRRLRDRNGNWIACRHDAARRLAEMADSIGRLLRFDYAGDSRRVQAIHLAKGAEDEIPGLLVRYGYDANAQLATVISREDRPLRRFAYTDGLMTWQESAGGFSCGYEWEPADAATGPEGDRRVLRHWTGDGEHWDIAYAEASGPDAAGTTVATDQLGRRSSWCWDAGYNLTRYVDPLGHAWTLQWDADRKLRSVRNPGGGELRFAYNAHGMPVAETDPLGRSTRTLWDDRWFEPRKITLPDGRSYLFEYDDRGNHTVLIDPAGQETRYAYDRFGLLEAVTDALGGTSRLRWNRRAQVVARTDCSGKTTRFAYDAWGFPQSVTDAAGQSTRFVHDAMGRLLSMSQPDGSHHAYRYDAAGRLVGAVDPLSRGTQLVLNARGQPTLQQDAQGRRIELHYDGGHRLHALVNENGMHFRFAHDEADRVVEEHRAGGTRVCIEYDANGWPSAVVHYPGIGDEDLALDGGADGGTRTQPLRTEFVRDAAGRLVEKRTARHRYRYRYDALDQLVEACKLAPAEAGGEPRALHRVAFEYDRLGNLAAETAIDETTGERHALRHEHDALGNRTRTLLPALGDGGVQRALNYLHYGSGHLHQVNLWQRHGDAPAEHALVSDIERDNLHREVARTQGRLATRFAWDPLGRRVASWCRAASLGEAFTPRDAGWREAMDSAGTARARVLDGLMKEYGYDLAGELRHARHSLQGRTEHGYDATGRIEATRRVPRAASGAAANEERFAYDPAGNLLDSAMAGARGPGYVRDNLVRVFEDKRYDYDGHGRLVRKRAGRHTEQRFEWDEEHRLLAVRTTRRPGTPQAVTQHTRFDYDALGRRVARHDAFGSTRFVWEGLRLLEERRGGHATSYVYEPGSHVPLARLDAGQDTAGREAGELRYFHTAPSGLPEELSDSEGRLCWRASYRTWGATVSEQWETVALDGRPAVSGAPASPPLEQNLRLQGQYLDRDTGLHYNTFRFYDPDIGRFIGPDPIGLSGGINLGSYAPNPYGWIDPPGWAGGLWGGPGQPASFDTWFDNASVADVREAMANPASRDAIHTALRNGGGAHEWFPVSMADKAKELGFSAQELKKLTTPTREVWFQNVPDPRNPGETLSGPHSTGAALPEGQSGRASSLAHKILFAKLAGATSKAGALARIRNFANKYTRGGKSSIGKC